jgi:hypothetical protein
MVSTCNRYTTGGVNQLCLEYEHRLEHTGTEGGGRRGFSLCVFHVFHVNNNNTIKSTRASLFSPPAPNKEKNKTQTKGHSRHTYVRKTTINAIMY